MNTSSASERDKGQPTVTTYEKLLTEARAEYDAFSTITAKKYVPKLWEALKNENPDLSREDLRDRLERDCLQFWSERSILMALPDEAKDSKKQKFARLSQKKRISAAKTAAPLALKKEEIIIDTAGNPIKNDSAPTLSSDMIDNREDDFKFEFSIPKADIWYPMMLALKEDVIWFDVVFSTRTHDVISATVGERTRVSIHEKLQTDAKDP